MKQRILGSGSYGVVYLAVEPAGKMEIAVKSAGINNSISLRREGEFLDSLKGCPYIVRCFGEDISVEHGEQVYNLLLEYAPGKTLRHMIEVHGGNMPEKVVARYTYQLLRGIHHVHSLGFVHCDIKPENVLVFPTDHHGGNQLKMCDFGLAKLAGGQNDYGECHRGTLEYAPPESLTGKAYEPPKDIWALGCIVAEMLTRKPTMNMPLTKSEIPNHVSRSAKRFLKKCLEIEPQQRWTAEMLLGHQFVKRFAVLENEVNPLECTQWMSSKGMFGSPVNGKAAYDSSAFVQYVLFPRKDDEDNRRRFMFPCGEELFKQN